MTNHLFVYDHSPDHYACPSDTDGDGNCGNRWCPECFGNPYTNKTDHIEVISVPGSPPVNLHPGDTLTVGLIELVRA